MTTPTQNDQSAEDCDELLNWESEANAIIRDVKDHVADIFVSSAIPSNRSQIFLNVTTLEQERICVRVSCEGFRVVGKDHDRQLPDEELDTETFDTPYALLGQVSNGYTNSFGNCLSNALMKLADSKSS